DIPTVMVFSRWGKVAAAVTATELITRFGVTHLLFTGVAGAVDPRLRIGDIVVGESLVQHDLDARPIFKQFEVPLLRQTRLTTDLRDRETLWQAALHFVQQQFSTVISSEAKEEFALAQPAVYLGEIATGDQFFTSSMAAAGLRARLPNALCVEMEGAAVAQVCAEYGVPMTVFRTISDSANEHAPINFSHFTKNVAARYSHAIVENWLTRFRSSDS
ncbi:MAG: 5'-methylthioadenosine/adenosylhomocysteine nucleosidase, partial [Bdellovibrio sp.]